FVPHRQRGARRPRRSTIALLRLERHAPSSHTTPSPRHGGCTLHSRRLIREEKFMRPDDYIEFDATGLAELVQCGEVSPQELAEAAIKRIDALNPRLNAVVERSYDLARSAAQRTDLKAPLAGVPFLAKDLNIDVAGLHLTAVCRWVVGVSGGTVGAPPVAR